MDRAVLVIRGSPRGGGLLLSFRFGASGCYGDESAVGEARWSTVVYGGVDSTPAGTGAGPLCEKPLRPRTFDLTCACLREGARMRSVMAAVLTIRACICLGQLRAVALGARKSKILQDDGSVVGAPLWSGVMHGRVDNTRAGTGTDFLLRDLSTRRDTLEAHI